MSRETEFDFGLQRNLIAHLGVRLGLGSSGPWVGSNASFDREDNHVRSSDDIRTILNNLNADGIEGCRIGMLLVSRTIIGIGNNGTIVFEGVFGGRPVAVKRLLWDHCVVAFNEIQHLIACDQHENIVHYYGMEYDENFVYLALQRCTCSLDDLIQAHLDSSVLLHENKIKLDSLRVKMQDVNLWRPDGYPSTLLLKLMRDMVSGLVHLHKLGIIHRDLKPQNVLIAERELLCAKLSDMGISGRLRGDKSSLTNPTSGCGSLGWQAPEQLLNERQTCGMDVFSLGCVLFFCITRGRHPFGESLEREINIVNNKMDLSLVEFIPEAHDLFSHLLNRDPKLRPKASEVLHHPFFWSSERRLSFLRDFSDTVQLENRRAPNSDFLKELESKAPLVFYGNWDNKIESIFTADIDTRHYEYSLVIDLLRVVRRNWAHYRKLPEEVKELLGPAPEGYNDYFTKRFPRLLMESYRVASHFCKEEECMRKYFGRGDAL